MPTRHGVLREGAVAGILGGTAVDLWFFVVDLAAGAPLFTPVALGAALFGLDPGPGARRLQLLLVAGYTVFHYAAFLAVGLLAAGLLHLADREPALLALYFILFEVLELGFHGMVAILHETRLLDGLEWYQIALGNLVASALMGSYLWYSHPVLRHGLRHALSH